VTTVQVGPRDDGEGYTAIIGGLESFDFTHFGEFNNHLRTAENQGDLVVSEIDASGYQTCDDAHGCCYAATRLIVYKKPDKWVVQKSCDEHEGSFSAVSHPCQELPFDPAVTKRPEWSARLDLNNVEAARNLRAIVLPNLLRRDILGPDEGWAR
jgi:hypothetical protein